MRSKSFIPEGGGIQVLPIMWRQIEELKINLKHDQARKSFRNEASVTLEDITLHTVPSIRMLVSDVVLDGIFHFSIVVLLYMTPKYRQEMLNHVTNECISQVINDSIVNRIYSLYQERNPNFKGKVSIFGHSLGSLLALDIVSHQKNIKHKVDKVIPEVDLSDLLINGSIPDLKGMMNKTEISYKKLDFEVECFFGNIIQSHIKLSDRLWDSFCYFRVTSSALIRTISLYRKII